MTDQHDHQHVEPWTVTAINVAADSGNDIHDDDAARELGYERALVAGVTTYGYLLRQVVAALGDSWLDRGTVEVRLRQPAYAGERFIVTAEHAPLASIRAAAVRDDGVVVATADATPGAPGPLPARAHPLVPPRDEPYAPVRSALDGVAHFPTVEYTIDDAWQHKLLTDIGNDLTVFGDRGIVHPVIYGDLANLSLMHSVALGPWIHARSRVRHHRPLRVGETVSVRPRIHELTTDNGAEFLTLDTAVVVDDLLVARIEHAVIYAMNRRPT
jgi:acyl dehydratase